MINAFHSGKSFYFIDLSKRTKKINPPQGQLGDLEDNMEEIKTPVRPGTGHDRASVVLEAGEKYSDPHREMKNSGKTPEAQKN